MKPVLIFFAFFISTFIPSKCHSPRSSCWMLYSIKSAKDSAVKYIPEEIKPYLAIEDSLCYGYTGCNSFSARCNVKKDSIIFSLASATKKYCSTSQWVENAMLHDLMNGTVSYSIKGDTLLLFGNKSDVFKFSKRTGNTNCKD